MRQKDNLVQQEKKLQKMIQPLPKRTFRFPFHYLRTVLFSIAALITLPIGLMLIMVGIDLQENLRSDWVQTTATVLNNDEEGIRYRVDNDDFNTDGALGYTLEDFVDTSITSEVMVSATLCDLVGWVIIPKETGTEFPLWVNPAKITQQSCLPITQEYGTIYMITGIVLSILSVLRLLRSFNAAGIRRK